MTAIHGQGHKTLSRDTFLNNPNNGDLISANIHQHHDLFDFSYVVVMPIKSVGFLEGLKVLPHPISIGAGEFITSGCYDICFAGPLQPSPMIL